MADQDGFQSLVTLLSNILEAHTAALFIHDQKANELQLVASQSTSKHLRDRIALPLDKSGILAQVYKQGQPLHLGKAALENVGAALPFYREEEADIKALFVAPVGKTRGLVYVDSKRVWGFPDIQQKWVVEMAAVLDGLVRQECGLIERDDYCRALNLWRRLAEAAHTQSSAEELARTAVDQCAGFLSADYAMLAGRTQGQPRFSLIAATESVPSAYSRQDFLAQTGLIGWVFRNAKSILIPKMNPDSSDHLVLTANETFPHGGTFWGLHQAVSPDREVVLALLTRNERRWPADDRQVLMEAFRLGMVAYSRLLWREQCERLERYDPVTGLHNALAFERAVSEQLTTGLQGSKPFTLVLVQFEPWQLCLCKVSPAEGRRWQRQIAEELQQDLPAGVVVAQLGECRFALLFPDQGEAEVERFCARVPLFRREFEPAQRRGVKIRPYMGWASCPQHATRLEELWGRAYQSMWKDFQRLTKH
ncbi:MAG: hypothetical protein COT06_01345 [Syntrophobacteraceae bacterium CG07_land_8_20_14_0_80_61_8]|nr:MAG: hypothetical protein COT06_01345 [Syntrophobacteraceae bacterium CG07_land_8_20_14_0_80_61_8]